MCRLDTFKVDWLKHDTRLWPTQVRRIILPSPVALGVSAGFAHAEAGRTAIVEMNRPNDELIEWSFGNDGFRLRLTLSRDPFPCASLRNLTTQREWIHPTTPSDELRIDLEEPQRGMRLTPF